GRLHTMHSLFPSESRPWHDNSMFAGLNAAILEQCPITGEFNASFEIILLYQDVKGNHYSLYYDIKIRYPETHVEEEEPVLGSGIYLQTRKVSVETAWKRRLRELFNKRID